MTSPAYSLTGRGMASALLCRPRAKQDVRVISRRHGGGLPARIVVAVAGKYYEVRPSTLEDFEGGSTPEYLGLEEYQIPDEPEDYPEYDRAASAADRAYQFKREGSI